MLRPLCLLCCTLLCASVFSFSQCAPTAPPSVHICKPLANSIVPLTFEIQAAVNSNNGISQVQVYLDHTLITTQTAPQVDVQATAPASGSHEVWVRFYDNAQHATTTAYYINVGTNGNSAAAERVCQPPTLAPAVNICSPVQASSLANGKIHVGARMNSLQGVGASAVYLDNIEVYHILNSGVIETDIAAAPGAHNVVVQFWDNHGNATKKSVQVNVTPSMTTGDINVIKHVFFTIQENRSFDDYFGMGGVYRQAKGYDDPFDGVPLNVQLKDVYGNLVSPFHYQTECTEDLTGSWDEAHYDIDNGKMDNFLQTTRSIPSTIDPAGTRAIGYYDWTDLPYYYELMFQFGTSDRYFADVPANTPSNRKYLFAATSFGHAFNSTPPTGGWTQQTLFDALSNAGVSWRYYYQDHIFLQEWKAYNRYSSHVFPLSQYYTDIQSETTLPAVIFIDQADSTGYNEHPGANIQLGAQRMAQIINALMASPSWQDSVFFLSYDEGGGLYDHVVPPIVQPPDYVPPTDLKPHDLPGDFSTAGFRVPFIALSPFSKPHYVSHFPRTQDSILRFIETRFHVAPLTLRDASADDLTEMFDFTTAPFLIPPVLPPQPTNGVCDYQKEKATGY